MMGKAGLSRLLSRGVHLDAKSVRGPCYDMMSESKESCCRQEVGGRGRGSENCPCVHPSKAGPRVRPTLRWSEMDSNCRSPVAKEMNPFREREPSWRDRGDKSPPRSGNLSSGYRWLESISLQQRVYELSVPERGMGRAARKRSVGASEPATAGTKSRPIDVVAGHDKGHPLVAGRRKGGLR
jgi:hypothetical protein